MNEFQIFKRGRTPKTRPADGYVALFFDTSRGSFRYVNSSGAIADVGGSGGGGGISDAPSDGTPYNRQDAGWVSAAAGSGLTHPQVMARAAFGGF